MLILLILACPNDQKLGVYDAEPSASIVNPIDGAVVNEGETVTFVANAQDRETPLDELAVSLTDSVVGLLGEGLAVEEGGTVAFPAVATGVGPHTVTLTVVDSAGQSASASVAFTVADVAEAPTIAVVHPESGESARDDQPFLFVASVADAQDAPETLTVSVVSDEAGPLCEGVPDAVGTVQCEATLAAFTHHLTFTVTDPGGLSGTAGAGLLVRDHEDIDDDLDGWSELQGDCDDADNRAHPGASETFDGVDEDCDGQADNDTSGFDDDGDGYTELDGDCDDADASSNPGGTEVVDGADNDCDGVLENDTTVFDDDGDGWTEAGGDCDDTHLESYPSATELEDGLDNDCDSVTDEGTAAYDDDLDGYSENAGDCDDAADDVYPGAPEDTGNYVDEDCNGVAEEDFDADGYLSLSTGGDDCDDADASTFAGSAPEDSLTDCMTDADDDDFGDSSAPAGVTAGSDCDDGDDTINPDATEECDGTDNDCDGSVDEVNASGCSTRYYDYDSDSYGSSAVAGQCLCAASGYYTSSYNTDCYDQNANAYPGATAYRTSDRGDGSYDYDCSGSNEKKYDDVGVCTITSLCAVTKGWKSSVKSCGSSGDYITACAFSLALLDCSATTSSYTQACR